MTDSVSVIFGVQVEPASLVSTHPFLFALFVANGLFCARVFSESVPHPDPATVPSSKSESRSRDPPGLQMSSEMPECEGVDPLQEIRNTAMLSDFLHKKLIRK
jgi:hypothetical protein